MSARTSSVTGRILFVIANLFYTVGAYAADFNETHVYNPTWPPHARFHNGQTMSLSVLLAATSIWLANRKAASIQQRQHDLFLAAAVGSFYCGSALSAILYPGTSWADPPYEPEIKGAQAYFFAVQLVFVWCAYLLESRSTQRTLKTE